MDVPINAEVQCTDGEYGQTTRIILNPITNTVTHVVVKTSGLTGTEVVVPIKELEQSTPQSIQVSYTRQELNALPSFLEDAFIPADESLIDYAGDATLLWPYIALFGNDHRGISRETLAIRRGNSVLATDGSIGHVDELVVNPTTDAFTHLVMREGHLWARRDITISVAQIDHIDDGNIYLKLTKQRVEDLPTIPVQRRHWN